MLRTRWRLANALSAVLKHKNYSVDAVYNGIDAYNYAIAQDYDGITLDIMMPGMNGIQVLTKLREKGIDSPVLQLTAKSDIDDRINGLDSGADDYLTKPFAMGELLARIRAMTRHHTVLPSTLTFETFLSTDRALSFQVLTASEAWQQRVSNDRSPYAKSRHAYFHRAFHGKDMGL